MLWGIQAFKLADMYKGKCTTDVFVQNHRALQSFIAIQRLAKLPFGTQTTRWITTMLQKCSQKKQTIEVFWMWNWIVSCNLLSWAIRSVFKEPVTHNKDNYTDRWLVHTNIFTCWSVAYLTNEIPKSANYIPNNFSLTRFQGIIL